MCGAEGGYGHGEEGHTCASLQGLLPIQVAPFATQEDPLPQQKWPNVWQPK